MKIIIELDNEVYEQIKTHGNVSEFHNLINRGIPLPENSTNGDVIKAMFPDIYTEECDYDVFTTLDTDTRFTYDWWNAPYRMKSEG